MTETPAQVFSLRTIMAFTAPTIVQFQMQFARDFPYGSNTQTSVTTNDINNAFNMVNVNINQALFFDQTSYTLGYLLLAAHFLVLNLRASSQGLNGQYNFLQDSKGVGGVSESFSIPQWILDNPLWSMYAKTNYGATFLSLVMPQLIAPAFTVAGRTKP